MRMIHNARVLPMVGAPLPSGDILIDGGKILEIGPQLRVPEGCEVIDATGLLATPGLIDAHCHVGMIEEGAGYNIAAANEASDPFTPQLRAYDGLNPRSEAFAHALEGGVTTVMTGPGSGNLIGGQFALLKTAGSRVEDMAIRPCAAMKMALGENPLRYYGAQKKVPVTRMAVASEIRTFLRRAKTYFDAVQSGTVPAFDPKLEAMLPVFRGEMPLKIHVHRIDDIFTAIRLAKEFELPFTLDHCTQAHLDAEALAREIDCALVGPSLIAPSKKEVEQVSFSTAAALHRQGVKVAIVSDWPIVPHSAFALLAGLAIRGGLPEEEAWRAITINPAQILKVSDRIGSLEPGKDADIVLFDGNPLRDVVAAPVMTLVDGKIAYVNPEKRG